MSRAVALVLSLVLQALVLLPTAARASSGTDGDRTLMVTASNSTGRTVTAGTPVTLTISVKWTDGAPIPDYPVRFSVSGSNEPSCITAAGSSDLQTNDDGWVRFTFTCFAAGSPTVTFQVLDASGTEVARGAEPFSFTTPPPPPVSDPTFTISVGSILVGQCAALTATGGGQLDVLVKGAGAPGFTKIQGLATGQRMRVCPSTTSSYQVRNGSAASGSTTLTVKAIQTLTVRRSGQSGGFAGHVVPGVLGRTVVAFCYVDGGRVQRIGVGTVGSGGNFAFAGPVNRPGKMVHCFAQTYADSHNAAGRSRLVDTQF